MKTKFLLSSFFFFSILNSEAQLTSDLVFAGAPSPSAMFLLIPPDAVAASLGWSGVASDSKFYSEFYNPAQTAFIKGDFDFTASYTPWLRALISDLDYKTFSLKIKTSNRNTINISYLHLSYGKIYILPVQKKLKQAESSIGLSDSYQISNSSSLGLKIKYIHSNTLINSFDTSTNTFRKFHSLSFGLSYYHMHDFVLFKKTMALNTGVSLDNVGSKISNDSLGLAAFIPIVLRAGQSIRINLSDKDQITFQYDIYKLLTPSNPVYQKDSLGNSTGIILSGENPNVPVLTGIVNSFSDAPGGFKEELSELNYCGGLEYGYNDLIFIRTGYFHESNSKGNARFITLGGAIKYSSTYSFELSAAYLIPVTQRNPLENTISLSLRIQ